MSYEEGFEAIVRRRSGSGAAVRYVGTLAQGVELERLGRRPLLNRLHALWGVGALTGSLGSVAAVRAGVPLAVHFAAIAAALCVLTLVAGRHALPDRWTASRRAPGARAGLFSGWTRAVLVLGGLGAAGALCEGTVSSWCGVFLHEQRGAVPAIASLGYFVFVLAQTGTRMFDDRAHRLLGPVALLRWSMAATVAGVLLVVLSPDPWTGLAGFALQGCGLAVVIPITAGAVGHGVGGNTSLAIARYSTLHQGGVLAGPALFGWLAQTLGVGTALALLVLPLGLIAALSSAVATAHPGAAAEEESAEQPRGVTARRKTISPPRRSPACWRPC
ncbi:MULTISPECIES: MFS transporter [Amycolatopsis]|uniref:MFS transporter n=1 Tax=Amycolatopsis bullii TaxID=941987 RepID=A0ABQ3KL62_9PSEU|nr:MFS transporter [Amycolatopsis bullii]GHG35672.1 hypothetical protein GCM10017567_65240 [Amycolatopsis bullii]